VNTLLAFNLIKEIILNPDKGWQSVKSNNITWQHIFVYITIPMVFLSTMATLVFAGHHFKIFNLTPNQIFIINVLGLLLGIAIGAKLISKISQFFAVNISFNDAVALVSFSFLPMFIANIISSFHPALAIINIFGLVYMILLFRKGMPILVETPGAKIFWFVASSLLILLIARVFATTIVAAITISLTGGGAGFVQ